MLQSNIYKVIEKTYKNIYNLLIVRLTQGSYSEDISYFFRIEELYWRLSFFNSLLIYSTDFTKSHITSFLVYNLLRFDVLIFFLCFFTNPCLTRIRRFNLKSETTNTKKLFAQKLDKCETYLPLFVLMVPLPLFL